MTAAKKPSSSRGAGTDRPAGPAENFTGSVRVDQPFQASAPGRASGARDVRTGARTAWHSHPLGQTLIVTSGVGRVQRWGDPVDEIRPGDVVWIPRRPEALARCLVDDGHDAHRDRRSGSTGRASTGWRRSPTSSTAPPPARGLPTAAPPVARSGRAADAGAAPHRRHRAQAGRSSPTTCSTATCGRARSSPARPQPRDDQRADRHEPARPAPLAPCPCPGQRRDRGRDRRVDHAPGLLRGLAERGHRGDGGEGSLRKT